VDPLPVLVVSPDPLARGGLVALVSSRAELLLAGEATAREAARAAASRPGAVLLFDLGAAGEGASALSDAAATATPVVALAPDEPRAADALRAGARAVLLRGAPPDAVAAALVAAARGLIVIDAAFAETFLRLPEGRESAEPLTPREREVLALLAEGLANKAIAARLGISEHTAKFHVNAILGKLGVDSRAEAIVRAARMGLVVL
jgi:two-component system, NarL family, nitrate/nitrite response regulator NarL